MTPERYQHVRRVFLEARDLEGEAQEAYLAACRKRDPELCAEVEALLDEEARAPKSQEPRSPDDTIFRRLPVIPDRIGPFKILEVLGEGGMGIVYLAEQREPVRRRVALKVIKPGMDSKAVITRFEAERQALAMMDHPNIAKIFDAGTTPDGRPYFVMEHVKGEPITTYADRHLLTTRERLKLFIHVCQAVQHAHSKTVIHRDIKPTNVLVAVTGDAPTPKVIDFGVAKATEHVLTTQTLFTQQGQLIGTPEYMSPEQAEMGALDIDTRTDVYSLGVMLYELLVGELPFEPTRLRRAGLMEIQRIIREQEPPRPSVRLSALGDGSSLAAQKRKSDPGTLRRQLHGDLDWITMKAMEKDRTRRYATASELAQHILLHLNDEPVPVGPPSVLYRLRKFVRRNKTGATAAAVVVLTIAVAMGGILQSAREARRQKERADEQTRKVTAQFRALQEMEYSSFLARATIAMDVDKNTLRAYWFLSQTPAAKRGWEVGHLLWRLNRSIRSFPCSSFEEAYSIDGRHVARYGDSGLKVVDVESGKAVFKHEIHQPVVDASFHPDGERLAIAMPDGMVHIWNGATGETVCSRRIRQHQGSLYQVEFSPDGRCVVVYGWANNPPGRCPAIVWDVETQSVCPVESLFLFLTSVAFCSDGSRLAIVGFPSEMGPGLVDDRFCVVDSATGKKLFSVTEDQVPEWVNCIAFSPDNTRMATAGGTSPIQIWDARTGAHLQSFARSDSAILSVAFDSTGSRIVSGERNGTVRVWDVGGGAELCAMCGHGYEVNFVRFTSDGKYIFSGDGYDVRFWQADPRPEFFNLDAGKGASRTVAFSPDGSKLGSCGWGLSFAIWDADSRTCLHRSNTTSDVSFESVVLNEDGTRLVAVHRDGLVVWEPQTGQDPIEVSTVSGNGGRNFGRIGLTPDGDRLVVRWSKQPERLVVFGVSPGGTFDELRSIPRDEEADDPFVISSDGKRVAFQSGGTVAVFDVETGERQTMIDPAFATCVVAMAFGKPDNRHLVITDCDDSVRVVDLLAGDVAHYLEGHTDRTQAVAYSTDGTRIVTGCDDKCIRIFDASNGELLLTLRGHSGPVEYVAFSPDGRRVLSIASGENGDEVRIWQSRPWTGDTFDDRFAQ